MGDFPKNVTIPRLVNDRPGDGVLELYRAATIKPRKIERSGFFSTGPQRRLKKSQKV